MFPACGGGTAVVAGAGRVFATAWPFEVGCSGAAAAAPELGVLLAEAAGGMGATIALDGADDWLVDAADELAVADDPTAVGGLLAQPATPMLMAAARTAAEITRFRDF
jgi:hypothetical protein